MKYVYNGYINWRREGMSTTKNDKLVEGKAMDTQVGGTHYKDLGLEPIAICLANKGYEAFAGSCYTKMLKYTSRIKDDEVEQLEKAAHVIAMWIDEAKNQKLKGK